jgi:hypothetical protein
VSTVGLESQNVELRTLEEFLLQFCLCDLDFNSLINLLCVSALVIGIVLDGGREECVDEGSFAQSRLASNLKRISTYPGNLMPYILTIIVKAAPRFATILWR